MLSYYHSGDPYVALKSFMRPKPKPGDAQLFYLPREGWIGRPGLLVTSSRSLTTEKLALCFHGVEELAPNEQSYGDHLVKEFRLFRLKRWREFAKLPR